MELLLNLLMMGWRVKALWNGKFYLQAEHDTHPDVFAKAEHLTTAVDELHAKAVKRSFKDDRKI